MHSTLWATFSCAYPGSFLKLSIVYNEDAFGFEGIGCDLDLRQGRSQLSWIEGNDRLVAEWRKAIIVLKSTIM
jgi:hypothetical protein